MLACYTLSRKDGLTSYGWHTFDGFDGEMLDFRGQVSAGNHACVVDDLI